MLNNCIFYRTQNRPLLILSDAEINKAIRKIFDPILVVVSNLCSTEELSVLVCITPLRPALSFVHHRHYHLGVPVTIFFVSSPLPKSCVITIH